MYTNFVTPIFNSPQNSFKIYRNIANLKSRIRNLEDKLRLLRLRNNDLQIELFKCSRKAKRTSELYFREKLNELQNEYDVLTKKMIIVSRTRETYDKLILNFTKESKSKNVLQKKISRPKTSMVKQLHYTPFERTKRHLHNLNISKKGNSSLPPLSKTTYIRNTGPITKSKTKKVFGTIDPEIMYDTIIKLRTEQELLKKQVDLALLIEDKYILWKKRLINGIKSPIHPLSIKRKNLRIKLLEAKLKLMDNEELYGKMREVIERIYSKMSKRRKCAKTLDMLYYIVDEVTKEYSLDSSRSSLTLPSIRHSTKPLSVTYTGDLPNLTFIGADFVPCSRSTRRVFSSLASSVHTPEDNGGTSCDLMNFARTIGNIHVERYHSFMCKWEHNVTVKRFEDIELETPRSEIESVCDLNTALELILNEYMTNMDMLHLLVYNELEVLKINPDSAQLISHRDYLISAIVDNFDSDTVLKFFNDNKLNIPSILWVVRDLIIFSDICNHIPKIFNIFAPIFDTNRSIYSSNSTHFIAWVSLFTSMFEADSRNKVYTGLCDLIDNFVYIEDPITYQTPLGKTKLYALFLLASYIPERFKGLLDLHNSVDSLCIKMLRDGFNGDEPTSCIDAAARYFSIAHAFANEESSALHLSMFYHYYSLEITKEDVYEDVIIPCIKTIRSVAESKSISSIRQIKKLYILQNVLSLFELEAYPKGRRICKAKPRLDDISYTNIPSLGLRESIPSLNLDNPKLQLHFQNKLQDNDDTDLSLDLSDITEPNEKEGTYLLKRNLNPIYHSNMLHAEVLELLFSIIIDHDVNRLDIEFCDPFPHINRKTNVLYPLIKHMEDSNNRCIKDAFQQTLKLENQNKGDEGVELEYVALSKRNTHGILDVSEIPIISFSKLNEISVRDTNYISLMREKVYSRKQAYTRMLRLTLPDMFNPKQYCNGNFVASGAFGVVMEIDKKIAVKILKKGLSEFDNPHLFEVYTEVSILDICKGDRRATQLVDYGCTESSYYIIMEYYPCTLKTWRKNLPHVDIKQLLRIYREFLNSCTLLYEKKINHFDIKCDNIMIDKNGFPALADFGESLCYSDDKNCYTLLNKGTEWIKSPEMLSIALTSTDANYDRRKKIGAGPASDIWSIGCLFYELITSKFLFSTTDWSKFYTRVTDNNQPILEPSNIKELEEYGCYKGKEFIEFILKRNPLARPSITQVISKFDEFFPEAKEGILPAFD